VQTALAAEAQPAERQCLLEEQTLNVENSRVYRAEKSKTDSFQKRTTEFIAKVNLNGSSSSSSSSSNGCGSDGGDGSSPDYLYLTYRKYSYAYKYRG
jgi:hypothetical protein